jgi:hypothetical protein
VSPNPDASLLVRRALLAHGASEILALVDQLNLQPNARVDVVILAPLRNLQRGRNAVGFAETGPLPAVKFLAELISQDALSRVVELLGENADAPSLEQLEQAVDALLSEEFSVTVVALMLALAAANDVPAKQHCVSLLESRDEFVLPELLVAPAASPLASPRVVDPKIREQRQKRREEQKLAKQRQQSRPLSRPAKSKASPTRSPELIRNTTSATVADATKPIVEINERRRFILTPLEEATFDTEHPLAGYVLALDIPFDAANTEELGVSAKLRPALVVAGANEELLVLPIFSNEAPGRRLITSWKKLGLDHVSYLGSDRVSVALEASAALRRIARVGNDEWNALI